MSKSKYRPSLSKNLLGMKFMKKTKDKLEKNEDEIGIMENYFHNCKKEDNFIVEPQYAVCEELIFGRLAFHGINPEIEKLNKERRNNKATQEVEEVSEKSLPNEEMVNRYSTLIENIQKKFTTKRKKINVRLAKKKFRNKNIKKTENK